MAITTDMIKQLREATGAGIMDAKRALEAEGGNLEKAKDYLRQQGLAKAGKKSGRDANDGLVDTYIHAQGRIGAMVEVSCETDFVARTDDFKALTKNIGMQVAAMSPRFVGRDDVKDEDWAELEREFGDRETAVKAVVLLEQDFIKDAKKTIGNLVTEAVSKMGENVIVRRFARFELGETTAGTESTEA